MPWFYYATKLLLKIALRLFTRWQVKGIENIPRRGGLLIVSNHLNLADPPLLGISLNRKAIFMAKEEVFRSRLTRYFFSGLGAFPVHREKLDRKALRQAKRVLDEGKVLVMFPEGTRSKNAQLQSAFSGAALVALRNGVPILPVAITGTERIKGSTWILRRPGLTVNFGSPFYPPPANGKLTKTDLAEFTNLIMGRIAELLPAEYRGIYAEQRK